MKTEEKRYTTSDFLDIVEKLRDPQDGCPWDMKQTHQSLRKNLIEECYEAVDAIDQNDPAYMKEELGDVLLQVAMHAQIAKEENLFDFEDVADTVSKKLVYRHPHIFSDIKADTEEKVLENWDTLKRASKAQERVSQSMRDIPKDFPAAMRCEKIQKKSHNIGFDYKNTVEATQILINTAKRLDNAIKKGNNRNSFEILGNLFFTAVAVCRLMGGDSEKIITDTAERFIKQFEKMEQLAERQGVDILKAEPQELHTLWEKSNFTCDELQV